MCVYVCVCLRESNYKRSPLDIFSRSFPSRLVSFSEKKCSAFCIALILHPCKNLSQRLFQLMSPLYLFLFRPISFILILFLSFSSFFSGSNLSLFSLPSTIPFPFTLSVPFPLYFFLSLFDPLLSFFLSPFLSHSHSLVSPSY